MNNSLDKLIASCLFRDVVANIADVSHLNVGDTVVITLENTDKIGTVAKVLDGTSFILKTNTGTEIIKPAKQGFIHMIRKAEHPIETLKLRNHTDYERDLKDMSKVTHQNNGRPEYGPEIDKDTKIPRSKICLNLKRKVSE